MNPTLVHQPFQYDFHSSSENDYYNREFLNPAGLSIDGLHQNGHRANQASHAVAQPIDLSLNNGLRYATQSSHLHDSIFQSTSTPLSPPDSQCGAASAIPNSGASSYQYSTPTLFSNNATATEQYTNAPASYLPQPWNDKPMPDFRPKGLAVLPPPSLSPPLSLGVTYHPSPSASIGSGPRLSDRYPTTYPAMYRPLTHPFSASDDWRNGPSYSHTRPSDPYSYSTSGYHTSNAMSLGQNVRPAPSRPEGPPFEVTQVAHCVINARSQQLTPDIAASIQKGFFQVDQKWTCYRRNYFAVSCSFNLGSGTIDGQLYVQYQHHAEVINQFAVSIAAKTAVHSNNQESETRALVQHTPKRDKATESIPGKIPVQACQPGAPSAPGSLVAGNGLYSGTQHMPNTMNDGYSTYGSARHQSPPTSHTFERIQFQKATANNGKRRAQQQYFHIVVELSAEISPRGQPSRWIRIATRESHPMVVRGRSPGHYKDGRRDSTTSMDPDRHSGSGSSGGGNYLGTILSSGRSHTTSMDWAPTHGSTSSGYHQAAESEYSPPSDDSSCSGSPSPQEGEMHQSSRNVPHSSIPSGENMMSRRLQQRDLSYEQGPPQHESQHFASSMCGSDAMLTNGAFCTTPGSFGLYAQHVAMPPPQTTCPS